jgi:hypothetical protein
VADGECPPQFVQLLFRENIGYQTHRLVDVQGHAIGGDDAGRFLPSML